MKIIINCIFIVIIETIFLISRKGIVVLKLMQDFERLQNITSIRSLFASTNLCRKSSSVGNFSQQFDKNLEHMWGLKKQISFRPITVTRLWSMWLLETTMLVVCVFQM